MTKNFLKPVLLLVPHYMGSLIYFEKLLPGLSDKYEVVFFPLFAKQKYFKEMVDYCEQKGYKLYLLKEPQLPSLIKKIRFVRELIWVWYFKSAARKIFCVLNVKKIIFVNDNSIYTRWLITEGNKKGIDTMVLQWALFYEGQRSRPLRLVKAWRKVFYKIGKPIYLFFRKIFRGLILGFGFEDGKFVIGAGPSRRMGVINSAAKDCFVRVGVPEKKISIVGHPDFYLAEKIMSDLNSDGLEKMKVADKYEINLSKKNVIFYSSPMYTKDVTILTLIEQLDYTRRLFVTVRKYLTEESYDLIFKVHPVEKADFYKPLEKIGVKIMDKQANNNELIFLSDLYIADSTFTDFIPIAMGKEAIFVNFFKLPSVESAKSCFGIKRFVEDWDEFEKLLKLYRDGKLPRQYESGGNIFVKDSLSKILAWVG